MRPLVDYVLTAGPMWLGLLLLPRLLVVVAAVLVVLTSLCSGSPVRHEQARSLIKDLTRMLEAMWPRIKRG